MSAAKSKLMNVLILASCLAGAVFLIYLGISSMPSSPSGSSTDDSAPREVMWKDLQQLDYKSGKVPASLQELHGKRIKVPGFVVPLETNAKITELLLVPNQAY